MPNLQPAWHNITALLRSLVPQSSANPAKSHKHSVALIALAALIAASPRLIRGLSCGHDFDFHLVSWLEVQRSWSQGVLYPHWAQSPNWSAGEPRFVFYPPLTWVLGALLGYLAPWEWVPTIFIFLSLAASGLATRELARQFLPPHAATLAGALATCTPYALFCAYERSAFAELAAAAWVPLLLLFALRQTKISPDGTSARPSAFNDALDGSAAPLALILAGAWLTNAPAGVMASYLLAFVAFIAALLRRALWPILRAAIAVVLGLGLAAIYLVPAAWEQRWIAIQQATDIGMRVQDSWLFARHSSLDLELHDRVLLLASVIVVFTALLAAAGFGLALRRRKLLASDRKLWLPIALLVPAIVLIQFPFSGWLWNLLPQLKFLQFPWRWLMVLGTPCVLFLAAATPLGSPKARRWSILCWTAALVISAGVASLFFFQYCDEEDRSLNQVAIFRAGSGVEGTDEYAPIASDNTLVPSGLPAGCLVTDPALELGESSTGSNADPDPDAVPMWFPEQGSCDEIYTADLWQSENKTLKINPDHDGFVILRLRRYPAWLVTINGQPVPAAAPQREDGLIAVPVQAGPSTISVRWITTPDALWGRVLSLIALCLVAALAWIERRGRLGRLS